MMNFVTPPDSQNVVKSELITNFRVDGVTVF